MTPLIYKRFREGKSTKNVVSLAASWLCSTKKVIFVRVARLNGTSNEASKSFNPNNNMKKTIFCMMLAAGLPMTAAANCIATEASAADKSLKTKRPKPSERLFQSQEVERCIKEVKAQLTNPYLAYLFENCLPNTLDTTVYPGETADGDDDTFVITGDITAMWLRDSGAQVWPYLRFAAKDKELAKLIRGVVRRQLRCLLIDPYANAFTQHPDSMSRWWTNDMTEMRPGVFERKYELDSPLYPIRLAHGYWKATGDASIFDGLWTDAMKIVLKTLREQQRKDGTSPYTFRRRTPAMHDTQSNHGMGHPAKPCGLIVSVFRPSDDATIFPYLIPSNFMAVSCLNKAAEVLSTVNKNAVLAGEFKALADEVDAALKQHAIVEHPKYGKVYAFEVDGYGSVLLMDDANVPSLLALPYISDVSLDDPIYQNTRRMVWSLDNPYFFKGTAGEGIGGPHEGLDYVWPMSDILKAMTSKDDAEIRECLIRLMNTDAGTGFMHEAYIKDDPTKFCRTWFAWANTLFGELILHLIDEGKLDLLNSLPVPEQAQ